MVFRDCDMTNKMCSYNKEKIQFLKASKKCRCNWDILHIDEPF